MLIFSFNWLCPYCVCAGQCACKEGFTGRQCDACAFGYRDFPQCVRCECNSAGSTNADPCRPCTCKVNTDSLYCQSQNRATARWRCPSQTSVSDISPVPPQVNVMGAHCDLCKPGFYNLQENNPLGCTDCFCFGVSNVCESSAWSTTQVTVIHLHTTATKKTHQMHPCSDILLFLQVLHGDAWLLPPLAPQNTPAIHDNDLATPGNTSSGHYHQDILLWDAPDSFRGNKVRHHLKCGHYFMAQQQEDRISEGSVSVVLNNCLSAWLTYCLFPAGLLWRLPKLFAGV